MSEAAMLTGGRASWSAAFGRDDQASRLRAMIAAPEEPAEPLPPAVHAARRARIVAVSSGKGGVGKTNTCVNLAVALAQMGLRATLVDADLGMANADVLCGLSPTRRLEHVLGGPPSARRRSLADIAVPAPGGFTLVPGSVGLARIADLSAADRQVLLSAIDELERTADLVLMDTGAGMGGSVVSFVRAADLGVIVATPDPTSITDAYALIKCALSSADCAHRAPVAPRLALVVNEASGRDEATRVHARISGVCSRFLGYQLPLLGWVAHDVRVARAVRARTPVLMASPRCEASRCLRELASRVAAEFGAGGRGAPADRAGGWATAVAGLFGRRG